MTEIRPGTYVFYDRMQARLGACSLEECAATVVCTVVSRPHEDLAVIDGGSKTFATDVQPGIEPLNLEGFGHVVGYPGATLERLTEEHGMLAVTGEARSEGGRHAADHPEPRLQHGKPPRRGLSGRRGRPVEEVRVAARGKVW